LRHEPDNIQALWFVTPLTNARLLQLQQQAEQLGLPLNQAQRAELDRRSGGGRHQGVLAQLKQAVSYREQDLLALLDRLTDTPLLLALDGVQDPHNLGACLRTADAAGVHAVLAPADRAVGLTPSVRKIASGASVPFVQVSNLARTLRQLQQRGLWVVGAAGEADNNLYEADLQGPLVIVLGAEGKGLRRLTREHCDRLVSI
ncbi:MAG: 23S rRNA (guanosine(2251)-2'-O)-methyltransferase RlmB, partial [Gammaproteobacteria bacterium]|nr:23S rRNA (guanosine(2251)-2'-O)-methyltransferase RlmB [Gammaproteobacteria bacterium]